MQSVEVIQSIRPVAAILVSIAAAFLIIASNRRPNEREFWSIAAGVIKFLIVVSMVPTVWAGNVLEYEFFNSLLPGLPIKFRVDAFGLLFAFTASLLWIATTIYSIGYMRTHKEKSQTRYFACFAIALSSVMGVAFSANLITLYLFYEILSFVTYPLVSHAETDKALAGAKKYIVYLLGTSKTFFLVAIVLTYVFAGTLEFSGEGVFPETVEPAILVIILILFIAGIAKGALMPFHNWLPGAMVAPTPVSALLHAVAVVKTGVFSILRVIFFVFGIEMLRDLDVSTIATYFVSFTIIVSSIIALTKDNLKARLAYSTISQLSYIILGALLLSPSGMVAGIIHISNHAFSKITLFFCAGSIYVAAHKTNVSQLKGLGRKLPWTMGAFFIASLSMIGIPPVAGFISKWYLVVGSMEADNYVVLIVLLTSTVLNAAYFLPITYKAFFEKPDDEDHHHEKVKEIPLMAIPLVLTAIASVLIGLYPDFFITLAQQVIK